MLVAQLPRGNTLQNPGPLQKCHVCIIQLCQLHTWSGFYLLFC